MTKRAAAPAGLVPADEQPEFNRTLFAICIFLFIAGLSNATLTDWADGLVSNVVNDLFSMAVFLVCLSAVYFGRMRSDTGLFVATTEALRNFYMSLLFIGLDDPGFAYAHDEIMRLLLLTCLFASVLGLAVNKNIALIYNLAGICMQFAYAALFQDDKYFREQFGLNFVIMTGNICVVYYYRTMLENLVKGLADALRSTRRYHSDLERLNESNRPFVVFGRNTAGLVHDFRNDLNTISISVQTMELRYAKGKEQREDELAAIEQALDSLERRIDKVKFLTSAAENAAPEELDLRRLAESALYPFTISPELRRHIRFGLAARGRVDFFGQRLAFLQIFENIVRNSCEAIVDSRGGAGREPADELGGDQDAWGAVEIGIEGDDAAIGLEFRDDGPGIANCVRQKCAGDCMSCACFAIGKSTKEYGSGYGMVNIIAAVRELGGDMAIRTGAEGTAIRIAIPRVRG